MTDDRDHTARRTVRKNLRDLDRTDGTRFAHYSRREVAATCHATEGQDHE